MTETEFVSRLHSLAIKEDESIRPPELPTSSVWRGTRVRRPTWKVQENQLAEDVHQESPVMAAEAIPPTPRPPSPQPPFHQPL